MRKDLQFEKLPQPSRSARAKLVVFELVPWMMDCFHATKLRRTAKPRFNDATTLARGSLTAGPAHTPLVGRSEEGADQQAIPTFVPCPKAL